MPTVHAMCLDACYSRHAARADNRTWYRLSFAQRTRYQRRAGCLVLTAVYADRTDLVCHENHPLFRIMSLVYHIILMYTSEAYRSHTMPIMISDHRIKD